MGMQEVLRWAQHVKSQGKDTYRIRLGCAFFLDVATLRGRCYDEDRTDGEVILEFLHFSKSRGAYPSSALGGTLRYMSGRTARARASMEGGIF